jgi:L-ascorbate metabolism protein UlaG (beta-lactamase superfamily)
MNFKPSKILLFLVLILTLNVSKAQQNEITIKFIGNCGLYMTDGITNIYSDFPYKSGAYGYMEFDDLSLDSVKENAIFIFSHKHADHYSGKNIRKILREKGGKKFTPRKANKLLEYAEGIPGLKVQVFKTKHKFSLKHVSYLITWHGKRIYLSGDTTNPETIGKIKNIDLAFVPHWILTIAKEQELKIDAKKFGVYHLYPQQTPIAKEHWDKTEYMRLLTRQGEEFTLKY